MNRIAPVILLLVLILIFPNAVRAFVDAPSPESPASPAQDEMVPDSVPVISDTDSARYEEPPYAVAEQKGQDQEEPAQGKSDRENDLSTEEKEEVPQIADPLLPLNKAIFKSNERLYFWVLKPVALVYSSVAPEPLRIVVNNFFDNLKAPARFVNNLLQGKMKRAGNEFIRFLFNSTAGLGGLADAAKELLHIQKSPADFGQTLGRYGMGPGFYLVLPIWGPSSLRDGVGLAADRAMYPLSFISFTNISFEAATGIFLFETVNHTSFHIGDYEAFKEAAIDPYVSMRNAYFQNRKKAVEE